MNYKLTEEDEKIIARKMRKLEVELLGPTYQRIKLQGERIELLSEESRSKLPFRTAKELYEAYGFVYPEE